MAYDTVEFKNLHDQILQAITQQKEYIDRQLGELKTNGVTSPETKEALERVRLRMDGLEARLNAPDAGTQQKQEKSIGQHFIESDEFQQFKRRGWHKGGCAFRISNPWDIERKTTISISAVGSSTSGVIPIYRLPGIVPVGQRTLRVRDLLPAYPTQANTVDFVQENVFTSAASPQAETSAKAEAALTFTTGTGIVRTIAHWIPASRQVLDDLPGLQAFINSKLLYGLKLKEETEILSGDNLGDHLNGLTTQASAYVGTYAAASDTKIDKLRHAILEAEAAEYPVDGIVLNPKDWHDIELIKTEEGGVNKGSYVVGLPSGAARGQVTGEGGTIPTIWGRPVVTSNSIASGKFLTGGFAMAAAIYDRMEATIDISTEHSDYFTKNLVAIRCEERITLAVFRPAAFRYGSF